MEGIDEGARHEEAGDKAHQARPEHLADRVFHPFEGIKVPAGPYEVGGFRAGQAEAGEAEGDVGSGQAGEQADAMHCGLESFNRRSVSEGAGFYGIEDI